MNTQPSGGGKLMRAAEVAPILGISASWLYKAAQRGEVPCYRFGSAIRFDPVELQAWAKGGRRDTAAVVALPNRATIEKD